MCRGGMSSRNNPTNFTLLLQFLVKIRLFVYFGGLFVIGLPLLLRALGVTTSASIRTALVVTVLSVMVLTYFGERRLDFSNS